MSSNKSKRSQKLGSSRRGRNNRDAGEVENDKQPESQDINPYTVSETQPASDQSAVAGIGEPTVTLELPAQSQLKDLQDPSRQTNVESKKRKMGSTRKSNRGKVQEPSEEESERRLDVTRGVTEELEVTEDVSVTENYDTKKDTSSAAEDLSVIKEQQNLNSDIMSETSAVDITTNADMLSVTGHTETTDGNISDHVQPRALDLTQNEEKQQQSTDAATNVVNTEEVQHEIRELAFTSDLISQPQAAGVSQDNHDIIMTEMKYEPVTEGFKGTAPPNQTDKRQNEDFTKLVEFENQDQQDLPNESLTYEINVLQGEQLVHDAITREENTPKHVCQHSDIDFKIQPLGSISNDHDQSDKAQSGQNDSICFSDHATESKTPQVNNQVEIFSEQIDLLQDTLPNITNATPIKNQEVRKDYQKCLNNHLDSATPSKDTVLNSMPDQASSVVTEEDKPETESTNTMANSSTDVRGQIINNATPSISSLNDNDQQCLTSSDRQEDCKNVKTKTENQSSGDENISNDSLLNKEHDVKLNIDLTCVENICAKDNLNEVTVENKRKQVQEVSEPTYIKQTVEYDGKISETPKLKDQSDEGALSPCEPIDSKVIHHISGESGTKEDMVKIQEDLDKPDHDKEITEDVSKASDAITSFDQLLPLTEISDFIKETVLIPAVSLYEEMQATNVLHDDSGELPSEIKMQPNEDFVHLQSSSPLLSDNKVSLDARPNNASHFLLNDTIDKDRQKESSIIDDRNLEIIEERNPQENLSGQSALSVGQHNTETTAVMNNDFGQIRQTIMDVLEMMSLNTEHEAISVDDASHDLNENLNDEKLLQTESDALKETQSFREGVIDEANDQQVVDCANLRPTHSGSDLADVLLEKSFSQKGNNKVPSVSGSVTDIDFSSNTVRDETEKLENVQDNEISATLLGQFQASFTSELVTTNTEAQLTSVEPTEPVERGQLSEPNIRHLISEATPLQDEVNVPISTTGLKRKMGSTRKTVRRKKNEDVDMFKESKDNCETNTDPSPLTKSVEEIQNDEKESKDTRLDSESKEKEFIQKQEPCSEKVGNELKDVRCAEEVKNSSTSQFGLQEKKQPCTEKQENKLVQTATDLLTKPEVSHDIPQTTEQKAALEPKNEAVEYGGIDTSTVHQIDSVVWDEVTDAKGKAELIQGDEKLEADVDLDGKVTSLHIEHSLDITEIQNDTLTDRTSMSAQVHSTSIKNVSASQADHPAPVNLMEQNAETNASLVIAVNVNLDKPDQNDSTSKDHSDNLTNREHDSEQFKRLGGFTHELEPAIDEMTCHSEYKSSGNKRKMGSTRSRKGQSAGRVKEGTLIMEMEKENNPKDTEICTATSEVETFNIIPETSHQSIEIHSVTLEPLNFMQPEKMDTSGQHELVDELHLDQTVESDTIILFPKQKNQEGQDIDKQSNCEARQLKDEINAGENLTSDNEVIESQATSQSLLSDVGSSKLEDFKIREQKNNYEDLSIKKENNDLKLSSDVTEVYSQQCAHNFLSLQTTKPSIVSNTAPTCVSDPVNDNNGKETAMEKDTAELHTQSETETKKFESKQKFQKSQQLNNEEETSEWKCMEDKKVDEQMEDQKATPSLLTEPQMSLAVCDPSLMNQKTDTLESRCERIDTPPIVLANVHHFDNVIPEARDALFMPEYKENVHIIGSQHDESQEKTLEDISKQNKITDKEQDESLDVHEHESKSAQDQLKTEDRVTSGQRRKMGSTRKGLRGHSAGGQKEVQEIDNNQEQAINEGNASCTNESRAAEESTESIKAATHGSPVDTVLQETQCGRQIAETTRQDDKPQTESEHFQISEIVCELEKSNQPSVLQITETMSNQNKGALQVPISQSSESPTPPGSPGKKRKIGSSRKISRNKLTEKINNENIEIEPETQKSIKCVETSNSMIMDNVTEDVQGAAEPRAEVQAPCQSNECSTTTTEHQGKRKFGSRRVAKDSSGLGVNTHDDYETGQQKTDIQRISDELWVCDPSFTTDLESTTTSQMQTEYGGTKTSLKVEEEDLPAVKATEVSLVSLHDIRKSLPSGESTEDQRPKIDFEQWNEPIPDFGLAVYNVVMVGDSNVGKTSFIRRLQSGNFTLNYSATIGVDTFVQTITLGNRTVKLYIWDTAGQERYHSITRQVFHKAQGLLLMYDISSAQSFHAVRDWITQVQEKASADVIMMLLGNKNDCAKREVEQNEGEVLSKEYNIHFMECSAASGQNVSECMKTLAWLLVKQGVRRAEDQTVLQPEPRQKKSGCC